MSLTSRQKVMKRRRDVSPSYNNHTNFESLDDSGVIKKTRRIDPERLAQKLDAGLVDEMESFILPGAVMPSYAVRKELQERYSVDRRVLYDYFHSRGLRVAKDERHNNLTRSRATKAELITTQEQNADSKSRQRRPSPHRSVMAPIYPNTPPTRRATSIKPKTSPIICESPLSQTPPSFAPPLSPCNTDVADTLRTCVLDWIDPSALPELTMSELDKENESPEWTPPEPWLISELDDFDFAETYVAAPLLPIDEYPLSAEQRAELYSLFDISLGYHTMMPHTGYAVSKTAAPDRYASLPSTSVIHEHDRSHSEQVSQHEWDTMFLADTIDPTFTPLLPSPHLTSSTSFGTKACKSGSSPSTRPPEETPNVEFTTAEHRCLLLSPKPVLHIKARPKSSCFSVSTPGCRRNRSFSFSNPGHL